MEECVKSEEFQHLSQTLTDLGIQRIAGLDDEVREFGGDRNSGGGGN
ncbi:MAG: hypothetical protein AAFY72_13750 [Cyanobacteria bacterium J06649_4]